MDQSSSNKDIEKQSDWGYLLGIKPKVLAKGLDEDCEGKKARRILRFGAQTTGQMGKA